MAASWIPVAGAALPVLGAVVKLVASLVSRSAEHRLETNVKRHSELLKVLPDDADRAPLLDLVNQEVAAVTTFHEKRLHRHVNGANVAAMVLLLLLAGGISFGLWSIPLPDHPHGRLALRAAAVLVGVTGFLAVSVGGLSNLWQDDREQPADSVEPPETSLHSSTPITAASRAPSGTDA